MSAMVIDKTARNFVGPAPDVRTYEADTAQYALTAPMPTRNAIDAVTDVTRGALDTYRPQQVQTKRVQSVVDNGLWRQSTPDEKTQQRRDYLQTYIVQAAAGAAGIVLVAYFAGVVDSGMGLGLWLALGTVFALLLTRLHARQEMQLSPEGLAHTAMNFDFGIAQYQAKGQYEILSAQADGMRVESRIREAKAQAELLRNLQTMQATQPVVQPVAQPAQRSEVRQSVRSATVQCDDELDAVSEDDAYAACAPYAVPVFERQYVQGCAVTASPPAAAMANTMFAPRKDEAVECLAGWLMKLYETSDAVDDNGLVLVQAPWSARASTPETYKERMKRIVAADPSLFEKVPGNRIRIRQEEYEDIDSALAWLYETATTV